MTNKGHESLRLRPNGSDGLGVRFASPKGGAKPLKGRRPYVRRNWRASDYVGRFASWAKKAGFHVIVEAQPPDNKRIVRVQQVTNCYVACILLRNRTSVCLESIDLGKDDPFQEASLAVLHTAFKEREYRVRVLNTYWYGDSYILTDGDGRLWRVLGVSLSTPESEEDFEFLPWSFSSSRTLLYPARQ